jgi:hypothetical protein
MVSYTRHLFEIMKKAGADPRNFESRKLLDRAVREVLDMERADSEDVWKVVKPILLGDPKERRQFEDRVAKLLVKFLITG